MKNPNTHNRLSKQSRLAYPESMNSNTHNRLIAGSNPAEPTFESKSSKIPRNIKM